MCEINDPEITPEEKAERLGDREREIADERAAQRRDDMTNEPQKPVPLKTLTKNDSKRFFSYIKKLKKVTCENVNTPCWQWTGSVNSRGYAQFWYGGKSFQASRVSYKIHFGKLRRSHFVCHHCDNKMCVNPRHIFSGTHTDNMRDMLKKNRHWSSKKTHCKRGHPFSIENTIFSKTKNMRTCIACQLIRRKQAGVRNRKSKTNPTEGESK